jgi:hypothetical protein
MHGESALNLNWFPGLAEAGTASWASLLRNDISWLCFLNPANWVFFFVARDHILESLSLYLAVYMVMTAMAAALAASLRFPRIGRIWQVALSLLYTFSGFILQYYSNFGWFPIILLFPLLLLGLERLLRDGRYVLYTVVYAYFLCRSVYFTYMATVYILLFSFGYCLFLLPKKQWGDRAMRLGLSTAAAYGLTAYFWLGSSSTFTSTSRFQSNLDSGLLTGFTTWNIAYTRHTVLMLMGMAFVLALMVRALLHHRHCSPAQQTQRKHIIGFFVYMLVLLLIPVVFTNIDTAWHFGQYNFFPMRYGYMLPATLLAGAGLILEENALEPVLETKTESRTQTWLRWGSIAGLTLCLCLLVPQVENTLKEYGACFLTALGRAGYWRYFALYVGCGLLYLGLYLLLFRLKNRKVASGCIAAVLLLQLGANTYGQIAPNDDHTYTHEYDPACIETADALQAYFADQDISALSRFKNVDNSLNAAYPVFARVSALSSVNSLNSDEKLRFFSDLGYTTNYFRILDTGGTVFSDMLLGVENVLTASPLDETLYSHGDVVDGIEIGTANYPGHIGLQFSAQALEAYDDCLTLPERLNCLYHAFTDTQDDLAYAPQATLTAQGEGLMTYTLTCQLPDTGFLYLAANGTMMNLSANDQDITVPSYLNLENRVYPGTFNSNLLYMGIFEAGTVEITFQSASGLTLDDLTLVALNKSQLDSFYDDASYDQATAITTDKNSLTITLTAETEGLELFLPLSFDTRWQCTVNGEPATTTEVLGTLTGIPLHQGQNVVTLVRSSNAPSLCLGLVLSLVSLALTLAWLALRRFCPACQRLALPSRLKSAAWWLFCLVCVGVFAFIYLAPTYYLLTQGTIVTF